MPPRTGNKMPVESIHDNLLRKSKDNVFEKYHVEKVLGVGSMGQVVKASIRPDKVGGSAFVAKRTICFGCFQIRPSNSTSIKNPLQGSGSKRFFAIKSIILECVNQTCVQEMKNEIEILRRLDSPNIVRLFEVYWGRNQIYLVLELCDGGDLYTRSPYSESQACKIAKQVLTAVNYMHDNGVVHRDLKLENIMFETKKSDAEVKIIDFGLSTKFLDRSGRAKRLTESVGSVYTMAPEVLQGRYTSQADLWSIGVIFYMLLSSFEPFPGDTQAKVADLIKRGQYKLDRPVWKTISDPGKDFVRRLLVVDPEKRMTAAEALKHEWIVNCTNCLKEPISEEILVVVEDSLLKYRQTSELRKLALMAIAHQSSSDEVLQLRKVFEDMDTLCNGIITYAEFKEALSKVHYSDEAIAEMFAAADMDEKGSINYTEFIAATIETQGRITEDRIAAAFDLLDCDDSGFISTRNLREVLGRNYSQKRIDAILKAGDLNNDGQISYEEFLSAFRAGEPGHQGSQVLATEN